MLTDTQQRHARSDGGAEFANRRRHLRQLRTSLLKLRGEGEQVAMADYDALRGACKALDNMLRIAEANLTEAKAIKRAWDKAIADATRALETIAAPGVADVIALADLGGQLHFRSGVIEGIEDYGWKYQAAVFVRNARDQLAWDCAHKNRRPAEFADEIRAAMPAAAEKNAELIRQINPIAVGQMLAKTA